MTLDVFPTTTAVELDDRLERDAFTFNGTVATGIPLERVTGLLDVVRDLAGVETRARVVSVNTVPSAAELASSAAGFAARSPVRRPRRYGLGLDQRALTRLARRGSGSASRSVIEGFAVWHAGDTDAESFARSPAPDLAMVIATVDAGEKPVSSRAAMQRGAHLAVLPRPGSPPPRRPCGSPGRLR